MKRTIAGSWVLAVLSACASPAPIEKGTAGGEGGEGPGRVEVEKVEFTPGPTSMGEAYRIVLINTGSENARFSAMPVFLSKEGYRIHGPAEWSELSLAPGERKELSGSCPFRLASSLQVRFKS